MSGLGLVQTGRILNRYSIDDGVLAEAPLLGRLALVTVVLAVDAALVVVLRVDATGISDRRDGRVHVLSTYSNFVTVHVCYGFLLRQ